MYYGFFLGIFRFRGDVVVGLLDVVCVFFVIRGVCGVGFSVLFGSLL